MIKKLAGVPGVARDAQWRNRIAVLCIMWQKTGGRNKLWKSVQSEMCAMLRTKGSSTYAKAHTCKKKKLASRVN